MMGRIQGVRGVPWRRCRGDTRPRRSGSPCRLVGLLAGLGQVRAQGRYVEHPAAVGDDPAVAADERVGPQGVAGVEDLHVRHPLGPSSRLSIGSSRS